MNRAFLLLGAAGAAVTLAFHLGRRILPPPPPPADPPKIQWFTPATGATIRAAESKFRADGSAARPSTVEAVPSCADVFKEAMAVAKQGGRMAIPLRCWEYVERHIGAANGKQRGTAR